jgi:hypothetical protein
MVLERGRGTRAVLVSVELGGLPRALDQCIREAVGEAAGCAPDEVFLSSTHTHSAPSVGGMFGWGGADALYVEGLPTRVAAAARDAIRQLQPVTWRYAEVPAEGIAVNREVDTGFALNADFTERIKTSWRPGKPELTDPILRLLVAEGRKGPVGLLHHFSCHPVVYGEKTNAIHGDFVGEACVALETEHAGAVALFLPGGLGDINPKLNHRSPAESRRALRAISQQYAQALRRAFKVAEPMPVAASFASQRRLQRFTRKPWNRASIARRIQKLESQLACREGADSPHTGSDDPLQTNGMLMARLEGLRAIIAQCRGERAPNPPVCLHALRIGPLVLAGCGLELYHSLAQQIMRETSIEQVWPVSLVGGVGYAPDAAALRRAGYAADFVPLICAELPFAHIHRELPQALVRLADRV